MGGYATGRHWHGIGWHGIGCTRSRGQLRRTIRSSHRWEVNSGRKGNDERRESSETAPTAVCESAHTHTPVLTDVEKSLTIALGPSDNWVPVSLTPAIHFPLSTSDSHFAIRRARLAVLARTFALPSPLAITLSRRLETTRMQFVCVC